jgi:hypothetical protein
VKLLQEDGVELVHMSEDELEFVIVLAYEVVTGEAGPLVDEEGELERVEEVFIMVEDVLFLGLASDDEGHEAEGQTQVLVEEDPVVVLHIESVAFVVVEGHELGVLLVVGLGDIVG